MNLGRLFAFDATKGTIDWTNSTGARSPAVSDDSLLVASPGSRNQGGRLLALDKTDGSIDWKTDRYDGLNTAPVVHRDAVFVCGNGANPAVWAFDTTDGELLWEAHLPEAAIEEGPFIERPIRPPAVSDDGVFVRTSSKLFGLNRGDGTRRWNVPTATPERDSSVADGVHRGNRLELPPVLCDDVVCSKRADGNFVARDLDSGGTRWLFDDFDGGHSYLSACTDGVTVYLAYNGEYDGRIVALDAADGSIDWYEEPTISGRYDPLVTDSAIYVGTDSGMSVLDKSDGSPLWATEFRDRDGGDMTVGYRGTPRSIGLTDETVFAVTNAGDVVALAR